MNDSIRKTLDRLADEANRGCGQVYELFAIRFSEAVDWAYPPSSPDHDEVMVLMQEDGVYLTSEERKRELEEWAEQGYCSHGLDPNCCPVGCGDLEYFDPGAE